MAAERCCCLCCGRAECGFLLTWYFDVYYEGKLRPEYDSGDHAHLNAAGTDVIVARAVPDVERQLMRLGSRPTR